MMFFFCSAWWGDWKNSFILPGRQATSAPWHAEQKTTDIQVINKDLNEDDHFTN